MPLASVIQNAKNGNSCIFFVYGVEDQIIFNLDLTNTDGSIRFLDNHSITLWHRGKRIDLFFNCTVNPFSRFRLEEYFLNVGNNFQQILLCKCTDDDGIVSQSSASFPYRQIRLLLFLSDLLEYPQDLHPVFDAAQQVHKAARILHWKE